MERAFRFNKFRNLGLKKTEKLVINHSLEKGKMGGLIILIGPNNSGKSNVLDALAEFKERTLVERDITSLEYSQEYLKPEVSFCVRNDTGDKYGLKIGIDTSNYIREVNDDKLIYSDEDIKEINACFKKISENYFPHIIRINSGYVNELNEIQKQISSNKDPNKIPEFIDKIYNSQLMARYRKHLNNRSLYGYGYNSLDPNIVKAAKEICETKLYSKFCAAKNSDVEQEFKNKYGINLIPNIVRYEPSAINEKHLVCEPRNIKSNELFAAIFNDKDIEEIQNAYNNLSKHVNYDILDELNEKFENKSQTISKRFNKMYFAEKDKYRFTLKFLESKIALTIRRGSKPIVLSYQSTGFKWFLNFYFSFYKNKFNPGDIIVMDEPATNLHPQGQVELRNFIKELAHKNDITFIIATHSPFLIDVDNYDELRVVSSEDNISHIDNLFTAININDPDTLLPIKESLTIQQHVLYDYDNTIIFVEGITDYNYLTMFKKILGKEKLAFVPIQGIGNTNELQDKIINKLIKINRNPILLVDSDKAGKSAVTRFKDKNIEIHSTDEFVSGAKEIEDLFSKQDQLKYKIREEKDAKRASCNSSLLKNFAEKKDFTSETIKNFKSVLDNLDN